MVRSNSFEWCVERLVFTFKNGWFININRLFAFSVIHTYYIGTYRANMSEGTDEGSASKNEIDLWALYKIPNACDISDAWLQINYLKVRDKILQNENKQISCTHSFRFRFRCLYTELCAHIYTRIVVNKRTNGRLHICRILRIEVGCTVTIRHNEIDLNWLLFWMMAD